MSMKSPLRIVVLLLLGIILIVSLSGCSKGKVLPEGRYEPVEPNAVSAIVIKRNNFTMEMAGITATTIKYEYENGVITFDAGTTAMSYPFEYKDGSLFLYTVEFKKV